MPRIPSMTITPGAYDAEVRFHFLDEEYLRDYLFYCWKEGTGGAYNTAQTSYVKEGNEFICTVTNLEPETFYDFHVSYSNVGAIGNEYSMRFKTLPAPFHITVTQKVEPSYFSTTLSADFTADVDYTPCGFMYRKFFTEDWTTVQVTPENNHLELVVTDFEQSTEYEFMVFYTVDGEVYQTDSRYFKTPEVPMPAITSMTVDIDGTSASLAERINLLRKPGRQQRNHRDRCENQKELSDKFQQNRRNIDLFLCIRRQADQRQEQTHSAISFFTNTANGGQPVRFGKLHCNTV